MTTITVFVRPGIEPYETNAQVDHISLVCQGITYEPVNHGYVNDLDKYTFEVNTEPDNTPALTVSVSDGIKTGERLG